MRRLLGAMTMLLLAAGCAGASPPSEGQAVQESIATGAEIAQLRCGACHAVSSTGVSPNPNAPPFPALSSRYRLEVLQEELINGLHVGVAEMPSFSFSIEEADALTAYLRSIQAPAPEPN